MGAIEEQLERARRAAGRKRRAPPVSAIPGEGRGPDGIAVALLAAGATDPCASDEDRYRTAVTQVHAVAAILQRHDIAGLIDAIDLADSVGPVVDPTAWRAKRDAMAEDREALQAARALWVFGRRMAERRAEAADPVAAYLRVRAEIDEATDTERREALNQECARLWLGLTADQRDAAGGGGT